MVKVKVVEWAMVFPSTFKVKTLASVIVISQYRGPGVAGISLAPPSVKSAELVPSLMTHFVLVESLESRNLTLLLSSSNLTKFQSLATPVANSAQKTIVRGKTTSARGVSVVNT